MKISTRNTLPNVDYISTQKTKRLKPRIIKFLQENMPCNFMSSEKEQDIDFIYSPKHGYGYAFAVSKFDDKFVKKLGDMQFRYRDMEIKKILKNMIENFNLSPVILWDRGMGVFVFNFFV